MRITIIIIITTAEKDEDKGKDEEKSRERYFVKINNGLVHNKAIKYQHCRSSDGHG